MKITKKILAALVAVLILSALIVNAWALETENVSFDNLESMRMDFTMDMDIDISMMGDSITAAKTEMEGTFGVTLNPERCSMDTTIISNGETQHLLSVYEPQGSNYAVYASYDEGKTWEKQIVSGDALPNGMVSSVDSFAKIAEFAKGFDKKRTEEIRGRKADVYSGVLSGEQLKEYLEITKSLNSLFASYGINIHDLDVSSFGGMPVTIALDSENGMLIRFEMDMKGFLQALMQRVMEAVMLSALQAEGYPEDFDISSLDIVVTISEANSSTTLYDFNAVGEIRMPTVG